MSFIIPQTAHEMRGLPSPFTEAAVACTWTTSSEFVFSVEGSIRPRREQSCAAQCGHPRSVTASTGTPEEARVGIAITPFSQSEELKLSDVHVLTSPETSSKEGLQPSLSPEIFSFSKQIGYRKRRL